MNDGDSGKPICKSGLANFTDSPLLSDVNFTLCCRSRHTWPRIRTVKMPRFAQQFIRERICYVHVIKL